MATRSIGRALALAALVLLAGVGAGYAQTESGRIEGIVVDSQGSVVPGVTVVVTSLATNAESVVVTDGAGRFVVTPVRAGRYSISVSLDGFQTARNDEFTLAVNQVLRLDFTLQPAGVTETVQVVSSTPMIDKVTSSIATVIDEQQVKDIPLNGRNFTQLATLTPGVTRGTPGSVSGGGDGGNAESFRYADTGGASLSVNGLREQFNNYLLDGVDNNESLVGSTLLFPPVEGIQEFRVITTNANAEFGRAGGAVINVVTKSGGNGLDGSAFWNYRPADLAATPYFVKKNNQDKPDFNRSQFGGSIGGPVVKNKLFFFGEYAGLRSDIPVEPGGFVTVPTQRMRNGDFSELLNASFTGLNAPIIIYDPVTGLPFANNVIPSGQITAVGQRYLNAFPLPTRSDRYQRNYATTRSRDSVYNDGTVRLDYVLSEKANMFARFGFNVDKFSDPGRIPGYQAGFGAGKTKNNSFGTAIGYNRVLTSSLINETRIGFNYQKFEFLPVAYGKNQNQEIGIPGPGGITSSNGISLIGGGNGSWIEYLGDFGQYVVPQTTFQFSNSTTWLRGAHTFKAGGTVIRRILDADRVRFGKGFYFFSDFTATPGNVPGLGFTGFEVSDMLIGRTNFTATGLPGNQNRSTLSWENSVFVQDDYQVNSKLTLNLGLRYDVLTPYVEKDDKLANYDPTTRKIVLPGQGGYPRATVDTDWNNLGPRAGFAYQIDDKTVARGAYGLFYTIQRAGIDNELTQSAPFGTVQFRFGGTGANVRLGDPIPLPETVNPASPSLPDGSALIYAPRDNKTPRIQQYSVSVQRELNPKTSAMVAYVGTRGDNLLAQLTSAGFSGSIESRLSTIQNNATSRYNAVQFQLRQMAWNGLTYLASYTLSKATNDSPGPFPGYNSRAATPTDARNLGLDDGNADYDRTHYFSLAATYELPFFRDGEGLEQRLLGGWQVNTILTFASGVPFSVYAGDFRAKLTGDPDGPKTEDEWFNTAAFSQAANVNEASERNILRAPGIATVDASVFKSFRFKNQALELRFEVFNLFDKAQFSIPGTFVGSSDFGEITSTRANTERQMQLAVRYTF